jgi:hypothetical protein
MMANQFPTIAVQTQNPDPTPAINAFLWVMPKIRSLGMTPKTEYTLAEHLLRGDAKIIFYSSADGVISLVQSEASINDEDAFDMLEFVMRRRKKRLQERRAKTANPQQSEINDTPAEPNSEIGEGRHGE